MLGKKLKKYDFGKIEKKWAKKWIADGTYEPDLKNAKKPFYNLMMFPYPSAEGLHIGAMRTFTGVDMYGRFKRMQGYDVFEPMGLDGFGIHSENYALKIGKHPIQHAKDSEKNFYRQLDTMGNGFAWKEKLETYDPNYYKWTQWIFVQLFKRGLAYRKKAPVNWCPSCKTVLANEQVIMDECERCGSKVTQKELEQWFFKITNYAQRLLDNLDKINWSEKIKIAQRNWIGRSEGSEVEFRIKNKELRIKVFTTRPDTIFGATYMVLGPEHPLLMNSEIRIKNQEEVEEYIKVAKVRTFEERIAEGKEKTGVELKGIKAINPATKEEIPVWIADYVLGDVGTGAIMAVPAHDQRDFEFAKKFNLPIKQVIKPVYIDRINSPRVDVENSQRRGVIVLIKHWSEEKYLLNASDKFKWKVLFTGGIEEGETPEEAAKREVIEETGYKNIKECYVLNFSHIDEFYAPHKNVNRRVDQTNVFVQLSNGSTVEIQDHEKDLHQIAWKTREEMLKEITHDNHRFVFEFAISGGGANDWPGVLINSGQFDGMDSEEAKWKITEFVGGQRKVQYRLRDWLVSRQRYWGPPIPMIYCGSPAGGCQWQSVPEKDLPVKLPNIKDFRPTGTDKSPLATVESFYKVKCPKCGGEARRETDVSDAFLDSAWYFLRYPSVGDNKQPWTLDITKKWLPVHMYIGGPEHAVLHLLYSRFISLALHDMGFLDFSLDGEPFPTFRAHGLITKDGAKMSKSRGNVVNPDDYIKAYGADAMRLYLAFLAPLEDSGDFRDTGINGMSRFLNRVWGLGLRLLNDGYAGDGNRNDFPLLQRKVHQTIKKVTEDIEALKYNTAISSLMMLLNEFEDEKNRSDRYGWFPLIWYKQFLLLLAPFAPHITEELWYELGGDSSIHTQPWPVFDSKLIVEDTFQLVIQINGKVRDTIEAPVGISQKDAEQLALQGEKVNQFLQGKTPKKIIFVPNRLLNFVI